MSGKKSKSSRSYIRSETKAVTHPVRARILKALKDGDKSTVDLESETGEARYNLYHHLGALEDAGFVTWEMRDNKTKLFQLKNPEESDVKVLVFDEDDIRSKRGRFESVWNALERVGGEDLQDVDKISHAEICLYYSRRKSKNE